jgi:hypothetical protein
MIYLHDVEGGTSKKMVDQRVLKLEARVSEHM